MKVAIEVDPRDSAKAWSVLVRCSAGMALPGRVFVVAEDAVRALRKAGVRFAELPYGAISAKGFTTVTPS